MPGTKTAARAKRTPLPTTSAWTWSTSTASQLKDARFYPAFVSLDRSKYIKGFDSLKRTVLHRLHKPERDDKNHSVLLLTNLAAGGHTFNPISVYYVFEGERLINIVAEVTNIPWLEKTTYILAIQGGNRISNSLHAKKLHVSPFNPHNNQLYEFDFSIAPAPPTARQISLRQLHFFHPRVRPPSAAGQRRNGRILQPRRLALHNSSRAAVRPDRLQDPLAGGQAVAAAICGVQSPLAPKQHDQWRKELHPQYGKRLLKRQLFDICSFRKPVERGAAQ